MRRLGALLLLLFASALAHAQGANTVTINFPGVPSGGCAFIMYGINAATGDFYDCLSGAWHAVGGGGGGTVTSVSGTANQIAVANGTTTPVISITNPLITPGIVTIPGGTLTTDVQTLLLTQTYNNAAVNFNGIKSVTVDTAHLATSYLRQDFGGVAGTTPEWQLDTSGNGTLAGTSTATAQKANGSGAGLIECTQGVSSIGLLDANSGGFMCPTSITTSWVIGLPSAAITTAGVFTVGAVSGQIMPGGFSATPALGTDGSVAGSLQVANGSSAAHTKWGSGATTSNEIDGPTVVPVNGDVLDCTVAGASTTCVLTDSGILATNVVTLAGSQVLTNKTLTSPIVNTQVTGTAVQGTDTKVLSAGTVAGTGAQLCTDAQGGATTSGCTAGGVTSVNTLTGAVVIEAATSGQMAVSGGSGAALTGAADMTYTTHTFATTTAGIFDWSAATGVASLKFPPVVGGTVLAGTVTGNLSAPITLINTNSTNNNTSIGVGISTPGTSTGQTTLNINGATTGGDLTDWGTGGAWSGGVLSGQTIVASVGIGGAFTSKGTTAGFIDFPQGSTSSGVTPCNAATSICEQAPTAVTSYLVTKPGAAGTGIRMNVNASNVVTQTFSSSFGAVSATSQTGSISTATVCAATANTACGQAGQYRLSYDIWGSGTACSNVTAGKVVFTLTWTDANGTAHTTVPWQLYDYKGAVLNDTGTFNFNTALGTEGANGSMILSTNGTVIQYASTYTACTTGTGTYNVHITTEQLQ